MSVDNTLRCEKTSDVLLLLKSSDFVAHDLTAAFDACPVAERTYADVNIVLALRQWSTLHQSMEFRCFVRDGLFVGACQRHAAEYFSFLSARAMQLSALLGHFWRDHIQERFTLRSCA